jgi:hypothetical protein
VRDERLENNEPTNFIRERPLMVVSDLHARLPEAVMVHPPVEGGFIAFIRFDGLSGGCFS